MSFAEAWFSVTLILAVIGVTTWAVINAISALHGHIERKFGWRYAENFIFAMIAIPLFLFFTAMLAVTVQKDVNSKHRLPAESVQQ